MLHPLPFVCASLSIVLTACHVPPRDHLITPAARAARRGDIATLQRLAAASQDLNAFDPGLNHWTPLLHAIHKRQRGAIDALIAAGADVNRATLAGLSPLEMAAGSAQPSIVRRLLHAGADPREPGVLTAAVTGCSAEILTALLQRAPELRVPHNARGHLAMLFARLNRCDAALDLVRMG